MNSLSVFGLCLQPRRIVVVNNGAARAMISTESDNEGVDKETLENEEFIEPESQD